MKELRKWVLKIGKANAKELLMERVGYSESTAQKLVAGSYMGLPFQLQREELVKLTGISEEILFPSVGAGGSDDPPPAAA